VTGDDVRKAGFRERWRGYDPRVIDPLLEETAKAIDDGQSVSELVRHARRRPFPMKLRGYHPDDVDRLLDRLQSA
jgi:DivIVA domain-containing protein